MKIRRKIWSVPIALTLVLLFAVMLGVSQYVAAQVPEGPVPVTPEDGRDVCDPNNDVDRPYRTDRDRGDG